MYKNIIINNSSKDGKDRFHKYPLGFSWRVLKIKDAQKIKRIFDIDNNWNTINNKKDIVSCMVTVGTDSRRKSRKINRKNIIRTLASNGIDNNVGLSPEKYYDYILDSSFTISPEGNGIDCHRHYEAWFCGCIPIIEYNKKLEEKYCGLPILWTTDYTEITKEYLKHKLSQFLHNKYDFDMLYLNHYDKKDKSIIIDQCNYWVNKRLNIKYY